MQPTLAHMVYLFSDLEFDLLTNHKQTNKQRSPTYFSVCLSLRACVNSRRAHIFDVQDTYRCHFEAEVKGKGHRILSKQEKTTPCLCLCPNMYSFYNLTIDLY